MDPEEVRSHWEDWATRYGADVRATTKARTAKALEVDALRRALVAAGLGDREGTVLEVGCGNGQNLIELARAFPGLRFTGLDYVPRMVAHAAESRDAAGLGERIRLLTGDLRDLDGASGLAPRYDAVLSVRCLINLASAAEQEAALRALARRVAPGGALLLIENSRSTHALQNDAREVLSLPRREPAAFNCFLDDGVFVPALESLFASVRIEDFAALHDLVLYALVPAATGGAIDYEHPLVDAAARLSVGLAARGLAAFGPFGQNRLYACVEPRASEAGP